jgi:hypothetical protein
MYFRHRVASVVVLTAYHMASAGSGVDGFSSVCFRLLRCVLKRIQKIIPGVSVGRGAVVSGC